MVISSVIIGLLLISTGSTIAEIQSQEFKTDSTSYYIQMLKNEAQKVDTGSSLERSKFKQLVDKVPEYSSRTVYWSSQTCFNVTLSRPGSTLRLKCIG